MNRHEKGDGLTSARDLGHAERVVLGAAVAVAIREAGAWLRKIASHMRRAWFRSRALPSALVNLDGRSCVPCQLRFEWGRFVGPVIALQWALCNILVLIRYPYHPAGNSLSAWLWTALSVMCKTFFFDRPKAQINADDIVSNQCRNVVSLKLQAGLQSSALSVIPFRMESGNRYLIYSSRGEV